jgi:phage/plasmid primase-like uncharacterized protein
MPVAKAIRAEDPDRQIVFMADNDHHLPRRESAATERWSREGA